MLAMFYHIFCTFYSLSNIQISFNGLNIGLNFLLILIPFVIFQPISPFDLTTRISFVILQSESPL